MNTHVPRARVTALAGGIALLLGVLGSHGLAQTDVYGLVPGQFPFWDNGNGGVWSLGTAPTATQDALFPASPGPNTTTPTFRPDGTEVGITNLNPFNPNPTANNMVVQGNYLFIATQPPTSVLAPASFLTLNQGNVTVTGQNLAIFDTNIVVTSGTLTKMGTGNMLLGRDWTITGGVLVQQGGFGGDGLITGSVVNHGTVLPFGSAPLQIQGNYTQSKNGTLAIGISGPFSYSQLAVGGRAKLDGTLAIEVANGFVPKQGEKFTIIDASRVSGTFGNVDAPTWGLFTLRPIYSADSVSLKVAVSSFGNLPGLSPNEQAVGNYLDKFTFDPKEAKLLSFLYNRSLNQLPRELDRLAPEELTSVFAMGVALEQIQSLNLQRRTDDIRSGSSGFSAAGLAINGSGPSYSGGLNITTGVAGPNGRSVDDGKDVKETKEVAPVENRWGAFLSGTGEWVNVSGTDNARGYNLDSGGFTLGVDYKVTPNFAIGLAAGYTGTTADLTDHGRVWVNGGKLGLYSTVFSGGWYADVAAFGGYNSYDTRRASVQGEARGDTDGGEINALFGTGYDFKAGGLTFGPTATFNYTYVGMNGFTEHDSLAPLDVHGSGAESLRTAFGIKASYDWKLGGLVLKPELRAAWQHEFGDSVYDLSSNFANGAGDSFLVEGPRVGRDSLLLGAGFAIQCSERMSTYFYYDGELARKNYQSNSVTGGFRVAF